MNLIEFGDCREIMRRWHMLGFKVQTCVTSPPYFGLRDYGHAGQLGLEKSPDEYVAAMVEVFQCVWDVLADDGTLWLNLGDSYARAGGWSNNNGLDGVATRHESSRAISNIATGGASQKLAQGLKSKDLIGIPWRVALALQADGWYLRQDIIWSKPNPMPESVTDRCTKAHEYIFMLAKKERYYYDHEAVKEPAVSTDIRKFTDNGADKQRGHGRKHAGFNGRYADKIAEQGVPETRNRRSVWNVATKPYKGAHFATFPEALIDPCVMAGSRPGDIVLDPFMGSGTTASVALKHGRQYLGCELNPEYEALQQDRLK
jgi:DNA modification methylase